jgi:hypothetical protein
MTAQTQDVLQALVILWTYMGAAVVMALIVGPRL